MGLMQTLRDLRTLLRVLLVPGAWAGEHRCDTCRRTVVRFNGAQRAAVAGRRLPVCGRRGCKGFLWRTPSRLMTGPEVAAYLRISRAEVREMVDAGELAAVGEIDGELIISEASLREFIAGAWVGGEPWL